MKISGKILDNNGEPLGLANVTIIDGVKANRLGAIASLDGSFFLDNELITPESNFTVSYIGFRPQTLQAKELNDKIIRLQESSENLKEVIVFGKPKQSNKIEVSKFKSHLQQHKFVYASIGLLGLLLIASSIKKQNYGK